MFDPYHKWLGIPEDQRPPTYYQLLGVAPPETDREVIEEMALRQTSHVRTYQTGPHAADCTRLLNEIAHARTVLLNPARRRAYDAHLRAAVYAGKQAEGRAQGQLPSAGACAAPAALAEEAPAAVFEGLDEPTPHCYRRRRKGLRPVAAAVGGLLLALITVGLAVWGGGAAGTAPATTPARVAATRPSPRAAPTGEVRHFHGRGAPIHAVALSADGRFALSGGGDPAGRLTAEAFAIRLWDVGTGKELRRLTGHEAPVWCVAFSADGKYALSGAGLFTAGIGEVKPVDCTLRLWEVAGGAELRRFEGHTGPVRGVAFLPTGHALSCGEDGTVRAWDVATGREAGRITALVPLHCLAQSPDGGLALAGGADGVARLWRLEGGRELACLDHGDGPVTAVAFAPDGRRALTAGCRPRAAEAATKSMEWFLQLWDVGQGTALCSFPGHTHPIRGVAFGPDGRWAVSGAFDGGVRLWDVTAGKEARGLAAHGAAVGAVAFSPDGRRVLSGGADGFVCLWVLPKKG
jgi:WD40 repeat protein